MKLLHTADWHIGRRLHGFDLEAEQLNAFKQIEQIAIKERVNGIIVAGDLYDRSLPSARSVQLFNAMIQRLNLIDHLPLYMISGNHDSAIRLSTGTPWYKASHLYLHTKIEQALIPIELEDTQIFLLPYFEPFQVRNYFADDSIQNLNQAFQKIVQKMKIAFNPNKAHILVSHFFASGSLHTDSETKLTVGGLAAVSTDLLTDFDYVALGHLHGKDALHSDIIQYSGSPVKFSLSESKQKKGVFIVDTNDPTQRKFVPLKSIHDVKELQASFADLTNHDYYEKIPRNDYLGITLTDLKPIPNVLARLRKIYPRIIEIKRTDSYNPGVKYQGESSSSIRKQDPMKLLTDFYQSVANEPINDQQLKWAKLALKKGDK